MDKLVVVFAVEGPRFHSSIELEERQARQIDEPRHSPAAGNQYRANTALRAGLRIGRNSWMLT